MRETIITSEMAVFKLKTEIYTFIQNEEAHAVTLTCLQKSFDSFQIVEEKILHSFELK